MNYLNAVISADAIDPFLVEDATGVVYAIERADLRSVYVGQTDNLKRRIGRHSRQIHKSSAPLFEGTAPVIRILGRYPVDELGEQENSAMDTYAAEGWTILSHRGGGVAAGRAAGVVGGKIGGHTGGHISGPVNVKIMNAKITAEQRSRIGKAGAAALTSEQRAAAGRIRGKLTGPANIKIANAKITPEQRAAAARTMNARRRQCTDCGLISSPGPIGTHLKTSGHTGYIDLSPVTTNK